MAQRSMVATQAPRDPLALGSVNLKNILFATDFSTCSRAVLPRLALLARRYEAKIFLTHVISPQLDSSFPPEAKVLQEHDWRESRRQLDDLSKLMAAIPHEVLLGHGDVDSVLLEMIQKHDIDLVVLGTHGRRGVSRLALGSVAEELIRTSPCPVLTCGPHAEEIVLPELQIREILFPTDLSEASIAALPYALSFTLEFSAHLTILHISSVNVAERPLLQNGLETWFRSQIPQDVFAWSEPEYVIERGDTGESILRVAKSRRADLLVLGVRSPHGWRSFHIGNILSTVLTRARSPVLTVRTALTAQAGGFPYPDMRS